MSDEFATREKVHDEEAGVKEETAEAQIHSSASSTIGSSPTPNHKNESVRKGGPPGQGRPSEKNPYEVGWDGPEDHENPQVRQLAL